MAARGKVSVEMTREDASGISAFILQVVRPSVKARVDTVLTPGFNENLADSLFRLAFVLRKVADRQRQTTSPFVTQIDRKLLEAFVMIGQQFDRHAIAEPWYHVFEVMKDALEKRRGRPRYSSDDRLKRLDPDFAIHDRNRWRIRRAKAEAEQEASQMNEMILNGETILTVRKPQQI